jgi:choline dehydrogenase-like flavoprotein
MARTIETDLCIIGSGITAAMVAEHVAEHRDARILVLEAGDESVPLGERGLRRQRFLDYGENAWLHDHVDGMEVAGIQSRTMQVGGQAMHWGGVTPRYSPEDFRVRSLYGIGDDWPVSYQDLDPFYQEAEERLGVSGAQGPTDLDPRGQPYPLPPLPLSWNLEQLKTWGEKADIPFWSQPSAKASQPWRGRAACCRSDTCAPICPVGAKYSPDFTWNALRQTSQFSLVPRTLVRRLVPAEGSSQIAHAVAVNRDSPDDPVEIRARTFVVACGYLWSPYLLLLSAGGRYPGGIANSSGLVGKYITGHRNVVGYVKLPFKLFPGMNAQHSLVTKHFMRPGPLKRYLRHDLRIWESTYAREPRFRDEQGRLLLGDATMTDWRARTTDGVARLRGYYDVHPAKDSGIVLDASRRTPWGDPLPRLTLIDGDASRELRGYSEESIEGVFRRMARAGGGEVLRVRQDAFQDHPAGGCRMGDDPSTSVVDSWGRTHDHENLFVVGAPTCVSASCANGTLTFSALALRAASKIAEAFPERPAG